MNRYTVHRLDGLEPDNLLAFIALLGLLRVLEEAQPSWRPRVLWTINEPPLRPALWVPKTASEDAVVEAAADGLRTLAPRHDFGELVDLKIHPARAAERLREAAINAEEDPYTAGLWAALVSNAVTYKEKTRPTPLCLLGGGRQRFLKNLAWVANQPTPPTRNISEAECLQEALFRRWHRQDNTQSFRWDPNEDVRHAYRWRAPTDDKEPTQHGANRLAAIGLSVLTVVPQLSHAGKTQLGVLCAVHAANDRSIFFGWPIWREPIGLAAIRALLGHPHLDNPKTCTALGIVERRRTRRISVNQYMNVTRADAQFNP